MQSIYERPLVKDNANIGLIAIQTQNILYGPPLVKSSFYGENRASDVELLSESTVSPIDSVALSHDERTVAYSTSTAVKLIDLNTGREVRTLVSQNGRVNDIAQSNRSIYSWASVSSDCTVTIWDARQHPANVHTRRLGRSANCLRFSPNDAFIALGSDQVYMMDPRVREMRSLPTSAQVLHVCFHPSYYLLATGSEDRLVRFWDIESEECVSRSEPTDGILKNIAFQSSGSSLLFLTDRRCGAMCWEPFEMLGQCFLANSNRSLALACGDIDVFVLGHSETSDKITLMSVSISELLDVNFTGSYPDRVKEKLCEEFCRKKRSTSEDGGNILENPVVESLSNNCENFDDKDFGDPFIPKRTLPRTPPRFRSPSPQPNWVVASPGNEKFSMSIANRTYAPPRPKSLKTSKATIFSTSRIPRILNYRVGSKNKMGGIAASKFSQNASQCNIAGNGMISHTYSAPDVRCNPRKKEVENKKVRIVTQRFKGSSTAVTNLKEGKSRYHSSNSNCVDDLIDKHEKLLRTLQQRRKQSEAALKCWRSRGFEAAMTDASKTNDIPVLIGLIDAVNHMPSSWTLSLCAAILPHLEYIFASKNGDFVEVALSSLRTIICGCGDIIMQGVKRCNIGVDVNADERHDKCVRCQQQLTSLRVKSSLITTKMTSRHQHEFNALMQILDENFFS